MVVVAGWYSIVQQKRTCTVLYGPERTTYKKGREWEGQEGVGGSWSRNGSIAKALPTAFNTWLSKFHR
jgi:hypothetical protein